MEYARIFGMLVIALLYAIVVMKITGKANLAPVSPIDQIQNYILGGIVGGVLFNKNLSILDFTFVMSVWAFLSIVLSYARKKSYRIHALLDGYPIPVIRDGAVIRSGIEKARLTLPSLYMKLRIQGVFDIARVEFAQVEPNGQLTIMHQQDREHMPRLLVLDQMIQNQELEALGKDEAWLYDILEKNGYNSFEEIAALEYYNNDTRIIRFVQ